MDDIIVVQIVDSLEDLSDGLGSIFLSELSVLAYSIEELSTSC